MGFIQVLINFIRKLFGMSSEPANLPPAPAHPGTPLAAPPPTPVSDTAGFDLDDDEDGFFEAVLYMESEGMISPTVTITEANRAETKAKYGIRDQSHWLSVKEACYAILARKHGSVEEVLQRESNWRSGLTQHHMQQEAVQKAKSGELNPVEGISLEQWAAMNAAIAQGTNINDMLKGQGIDMARWDRARTEWEARMARDTTFTIAQIYGVAFQNASTGKYAAYAKEAAAARAANRDLTMALPMDLEKFWEILKEQEYGSKLGHDPVETLKSCGLSIVDWCDLGAFIGYHIERTWAHNITQYQATMKKVEDRLAAKYPGVK